MLTISHDNVLIFKLILKLPSNKKSQIISFLCLQIFIKFTNTCTVSNMTCFEINSVYSM